jgi:FdhD protein
MIVDRIDDPAWRMLQAGRADDNGAVDPVACATAEEVPVAFSYGGVAYAVMMATPSDVEDFAVGFSVTEGIAAMPSDINGIEIRERGDGFEVDVVLRADAFRAFLSRRRVRNLRGHTSCGICGVEDLAGIAQQRAAAETPIGAGGTVTLAAIRAALGDLRGFQPLSRETHAAHAAAWATAQGQIMLVREDVGRHCALDKLIGACLRAGIDPGGGFCVVTSRCSFEMVQKAVVARIPVLVAVSAPTSLAVRSAEAAGLTLVARAGAERQYIYAGAGRIGR